MIHCTGGCNRYARARCCTVVTILGNMMVQWQLSNSTQLARLCQSIGTRGSILPCPPFSPSHLLRLSESLQIISSHQLREDRLSLALSRALQTNPSEVLALGDGVYRLDKICQDSSIEPTPEQHRDFVRRARAGLAHVREPALVARRDACLRNLGR